MEVSMKWVRAVIFLVIAGALFWALHFSHGMIPPLGKLFNPFAGFWLSNTKSERIVEEIKLPDLEGTVQVVWDERRVPHIFAQNDHDLYSAQGYITARDRLWQMEFQTRGVAGRLSEIIGKATVEYDRYQRRIGMMYAAENAMKAVSENPVGKAMIQAYTDGVNAYIKSLKKKSLPLEYKILNYSPEPWTMLKSALLVKYMAWDLTGFSTDFALTLLREKLGEKVVDELYPYSPPFLEPIVPSGTPWSFTANLPQKPEEESIPLSNLSGALTEKPDNGIGSNNWAVSGKLTKSGYPILCNDPHLGLNLPSLWYEVQLVSPEVNVYGVSLPGAPTVIIGFNRHIAWGMTNASSDVLDWYSIKFKESSRKEYLYEGEWRKTAFRVEEIRVKGGKSVFDEVCYTHHGPVVYHEGEKPYESHVPKDAALRWTGHDPSLEIMTFYTLNHATNYEDYLEALRHFDCPAMNLVFADVNGDIALWHSGKFPLRWKGQGRYVLDGSRSGADWRGWVPREHCPYVKNPVRGFVSSANQKPADSLYPYYLGWDYATFERGARINELLLGMKDITPEDMMGTQNDVKSLRAVKLLPLLIEHLEDKSLTPEERRSFEELKGWNFEYRSSFIAPTIFDYFWKALYEEIWKDEFEEEVYELQSPGSDVTLHLILNTPDSPYFDNKTTDEKETLDDIVFRAFKSGNEKLSKEFGLFGDAWVWGKTQGTDIVHLARIPALSRNNLRTNGTSRAINAISERFGPSWRMVVALGPEMKAWGIYPGGQSGNPGSRFYDNFVDAWVEGKYYELLFLKSADEENPAIVGRTRLKGGK